MSKITLASLKSFIRKNQDNIYIENINSFDGMVDGCEPCKRGFKKAQYINEYTKYNVGIKGIWLVGSSRDYFENYEDNKFKGIRVDNCCGSFIVATSKEDA